MVNVGMFCAIGIYLVIIIGITLYSRLNETSEDFLIASRKLKWFTLGIGVFASMISAYNIVLSLTFGYLFGIYLLLVMLGVVGANFLLYFILSRKLDVLKKNRVYSIVDYIRFMYGEKIAFSINLVFLFVLFFIIVLQIKINALVFSQMIGWDLNLTAVLIVLIVLFYSLLGGFRTIIKTDLFQGIFMFMILVLVFSLEKKIEIVTEVFSSIGNTSILVGAISLMIVQFLSFLVQPDLWQRYLSAKNARELKFGMISSSILILLFAFLFVYLGLAGKILGVDSDPNNLFYSIISQVGSEWVTPLVIVSLLAAFMSSLDSLLFVCSVQVSNEKFMSFLKGSLQNKVKVLLVVILVLSTVISLLLSDFLSAVFSLFSIVTIISSVFIFAIMFKPLEMELIAGLIVGVLLFLYWTFSGMITQEAYTSLIPACLTFGYLLVQRIGVSKL